MPGNALNPIPRNALAREDYGTLPQKDQFGRYSVGGSIGMNDIKGQFTRDPMMRGAGEMALDVLPVTGELRSADRMGQMYQDYQNAPTPIQKVLRAGEMGFEGGATVAGLIPFAKAAGATLGPLLIMMARRNDELDGLAKALKSQRGGMGHLPEIPQATDDTLQQAYGMKAEQFFDPNGVNYQQIYRQTGHRLDNPAPLDIPRNLDISKGPGRMQQGAITYHGSPHNIQPNTEGVVRFDHSKMGTGEGAQAYGWGTYLTESPDVANEYAIKGQQGIGSISKYSPDVDELPPSAWDEMAPIMRKHDIPGDISPNQTQPGAVRELLDNYGAKMNADERAVFEKYALPRASLYTVDLPDSKIAQMLDWDAPLSDQPESVKKALSEPIKTVAANMGFDEIGDPILWAQRNLDSPNGGGFYEIYAARRPSAQDASESLRDLGIPGIKYFDGNSRTAGKGTRNFVVFDENDMKILTRNGEPVAQSADSLLIK